MTPLNRTLFQTLNRRDLLQTGAAASLVASLTACSSTEPANPAQTLEIPGAEELIPENMPKAFSKTEMDRRWRKIRDRMEADNFDCLIVPQRPEGDADVKYLTESAANWVVFPLEGQVTSIFRRRREAQEAEEKMGLDVDMRISLLDRSQVIIDSLKELGLTKARIGVGNLSGTLRNDEGGVSYTTLDRVKQALPQCRFESAADLLMRVKLARGPEEIEVLRQVSRVGELAIRTIVETAKPGSLQRDIWFQTHKTMLEATGELSPRVSIRAGIEGNTANGKPLDERFESGQIIGQALSGSLLGYLSQINHSICLGPPVPGDWASAFNYCVETFHSLVDWIEPGKSFHDFSEFYRQKAQERGESAPGVVFHTGGPLNDGPRMGPDREDENQDLVLEPGMVFTIKPRVPVKGLATPAAQVGDPVLVTERGGERLGRRPLQVITLGA